MQVTAGIWKYNKVRQQKAGVQTAGNRLGQTGQKRNPKNSKITLRYGSIHCMKETRATIIISMTTHPKLNLNPYKNNLSPTAASLLNLTSNETERTHNLHSNTPGLKKKWRQQDPLTADQLDSHTERQPTLWTWTHVILWLLVNLIPRIVQVKTEPMSHVTLHSCTCSTGST